VARDRTSGPGFCLALRPGTRTLPMNSEFERLVARKEQAARTARIGYLLTEAAATEGRHLVEIGNAWSRRHYDGGFWLSPIPSDAPAVSLVFVQSRDGNTVTENPSALGGGDTDLHLIYEGLSRVAADGVMAGATTANGHTFFSVWVPELVALRESLSLPRHPVQIVVSRRGRLDFDNTLLFNVPEVTVFVLAAEAAIAACRRAAESRPWMTIVPINDDDLGAAVSLLKGYGIDRISAVGGRSVASSLIQAGVVQDLCLTTTAISAGAPGTPYYTGRKRLHRELIIRKKLAAGDEPGITVEQLAISVAT
jgi:riboflavin biosynthesis pyrimidine reductase